MAEKNKKRIYEYRGVSDAVYAEVTEDGDTFTTGEVKNFTGVLSLIHI